MTSNPPTSQETRKGHAQDGIPAIRFEDLPQDVLYTIVSKLPPKEFARTSVLSSRWRCMWSMCPRLTFDGVAVCKCNRPYLHQHTDKFIHKVTAVLQKHRGKQVQTLEVRIDFVDSLLVHHLNDLVAFAVSSRTKNLTLDLKPTELLKYNSRYEFPFQLLNSQSVSRLQHMQLSFVSMKPPLQFKGFPNLRKLHMQSVHASRKDIEHVLSHSCNLEWLRIDRCDLNDELMVDGFLSHLLYLHVECCKLTRIKFQAVNLATFQYEGAFVPIDLSYSSKLQNAYINFNAVVFQHALISLLKGLPNVQNLTFRIEWPQVEKQWLWDNPLKFSYLRHLQLFMFFSYCKDIDRVLYAVSFLRATPFIEKLEVHFTGRRLWLADVGPRRQDFGHCKYEYLKSMCITGFKGARGQVEFLLHVVENAPALEIVIVNTKQQVCMEVWSSGGSRPPFQEAKRRIMEAITDLSVALPQNVKFCVI